MRGIYNLLRTCMRHAWEIMFEEPGNVDVLHGQHRALLDAVLKGDAERARNAAHLHLSYVRATLQQLAQRPGKPRTPKPAPARRRTAKRA
jgi:DNA-binding FadR family transcriptional regulator